MSRRRQTKCNASRGKRLKYKQKRDNIQKSEMGKGGGGRGKGTRQSGATDHVVVPPAG
jgi:hypothetical protein